MEAVVDFFRHHVGLLWTTALAVFHFVATFVISVRVVMSNRSVGASLAWLVVVFVFPLAGPMLYILIGELRLGARRIAVLKRLAEPVRLRYARLDRPTLQVLWKEIGDDAELLARAGSKMLGVPALAGNRLELIADWEETYDRIIKDIDQAKTNCDCEFYIWHNAGRTHEIEEALIRAVKRGVVCRILVDALGSQKFLKSKTFRRMVAEGVQVKAALPGGIWRLPFVRFDLRLHRKIVLIDDTIAWTGSLNMVDPRFFKVRAGVGPWVDAMVRLQGPAVEALAITFQVDWYIETWDVRPSLPDLTGEQPIELIGESAVQVLPSGPAGRVEGIERVLISSIYAARRELVITTPYFVPSESLQMALSTAAQRGVRVTVVVPEKVDSLLVRWASQAFFADLSEAGVQIAKFQGGLLHTKSVTIDNRFSLFGSLNMDPRSFRLNFEITLAVYDEAFTTALRSLQGIYLQQSYIQDHRDWHRRPLLIRFVEKSARLLGPLL